MHSPCENRCEHDTEYVAIIMRKEEREKGKKQKKEFKDFLKTKKKIFISFIIFVYIYNFKYFKL